MSSTRQPERQPMTAGARRAFAVLFLLVILIGGGSIFFTVSVARSFCGIVSAATETPVQRPADPAAKPAQETQWEWYQRFRQLGDHLYC